MRHVFLLGALQFILSFPIKFPPLSPIQATRPLSQLHANELTAWIFFCSSEQKSSTVSPKGERPISLKRLKLELSSVIKSLSYKSKCFFFNDWFFVYTNISFKHFILNLYQY